MKTRHLILGLATLAMAAFIAIPAHAQDDSEPLGNVAKQKKSTKAKVVVTDEDMASSSSGDNADGSSDSSKKADDKTQSTADMQKELDDIIHDEALLKKKLDVLQQKADEATDDFRKNMYLDSIQNQQVTLKEFSDRRKELEAKISARKQKEKPQDKSEEKSEDKSKDKSEDKTEDKSQG